MGREGLPGPPGKAERENVPCRTAWLGPRVRKNPEHLEGRAHAERMGETTGYGRGWAEGVTDPGDGKSWRILSSG